MHAERPQVWDRTTTQPKGTYFHATLQHASLHPPLNLLYYFHSAASPPRRSQSMDEDLTQQHKLRSSAPSLPLSLSRLAVRVGQRV